ncbi:putative cyclin-F2-1 [Dichanthelium oligosanthes]|uniref:Putative cyclin-F2-1 n=1 Tax=Dichanthelium oligosanthes TaxID=888268 RepID=A0A1E5VTB1_9POAL|nr:putative cyclin-F2-1 [Dichanthelium oligosanthes]
MCAVAPFLLPGLACAAPRAAPVLDVRPPTMATTYAEGVSAMWRGYCYDDDDGDIGALLRGIDAVVRPPKPADLPMPSVEFHAMSRRHGDHDADFMAMLRGIPSVRVRGAGHASVPMDAHGDTPTTPVVVLAAPRSYGDEGDSVTITKQQQQQQCGGEYDADMDATFRAMETDPTERPSEDYLSSTQAGDMMMIDRAELIKKMHHFSRFYGLAMGALHRAVSYVDRVLSAKKINGGERQRLLLGIAAVFAAAKYEDRSTSRKIDADYAAMNAGCTRREVLDAERELVAALGYRLSGPTAYTFVDHFTRHIQDQEEGAAVRIRSLAHHLTDMALLDYRCVALLPSAVAASAILLARLTVLGYSTVPVAGYAIEDMRECIEAIYDMHENLQVWPGCAQMMADWELTTRHRYCLPPLSMLIGMH